MKTTLRLAVLVLAAAATIRAATTDELLASLRAAVAAEIQAARKTAKSGVPSEKLQTLTGALSQLQTVPTGENDARGMLQHVLTSLQTYSGSEKIAKLAKAAADQLGKEAQASLQAAANEADAVGKRCAEVGLNAKTAQELDAPLAELNKILNGSKRSLLNSLSNETGVLGTNLSILATTLQHRQDYLLRREAGDKEGALRALQQSRPQITTPDFNWIPRSVLISSYEQDRKAVLGDPGQLEAKIQAFGTQVLAATTAKEIDPILAELGLLQAGVANYDDRSERKDSELIRSTLEFARRWQEFLAARAAGNFEKARSVLGDLTGATRDYPGIARSEILARAYGDDPDAPGAKKGEGTPGVLLSPEQVLAKMKTLDDLDRLLPEFQASVTADRSNWSGISSELAALARIYRDLRAGNAARVNLNLSGSETRGQLASLRGQLAIFALPRILAVSEADQPQAGETALTYLRRMIATARERKDWPFARRILATMQTAQASDLLLQSSDSTALTNFLAGLNYEKAREFTLAVNSFQLALKTGSQLIPADEIGEKLAVIKRDHAAEYNTGMQLTISPPPPRYETYGRGYGDPRMAPPPGGNFGPSIPGVPGQPGKEQPVPVPAKAEAAPAAPKPAAPEPEPPKK